MASDNDIDLRDIMLEAIAEVREVFRAVMIDLTKPMVELELARVWSTLPPEMKDRMRQEMPEEYEMLMQEFGK
jgi:hypothetical protein